MADQTVEDEPEQEINESVVDDPVTTKNVQDHATSKVKKTTQLPLSRIKQIMKLDPEVHMATSESIFLLAKSAEVFINMLTKEALTYTRTSKKKTIQKKDINSAISNSEQLAFLDAMLD